MQTQTSSHTLVSWSHNIGPCPSPCLETHDDILICGAKRKKMLSINQRNCSTRSTSLLVKRPHGVGIAIALLWPFHPHRALITIISGRWRTALSRGLRRQQHHVGDGPVRFVVRPPQRAGGCQEGREGGHLPVPRWSHLLFGPEGKWEGGGVRYPHTDPIGILCARRTR